MAEADAGDTVAVDVERRWLGATGLEVPVVGVGTWQTFDVRDAPGQARAAAVVATALDRGARFFDSSPMYGRAEEVLADALGRRREEAIVATKVWAPDPAIGEEQVERALNWFGGHVELYQLHNLVAWRDHLPLLERRRDEGAIKAIGATHYTVAGFVELEKVMRSGRIAAIQVPYNPIEHEAAERILALAEQLDLGVVISRPFAGGALTRRSPSAHELEPLREFGVRTWGQALIKWILSDRRCHVTIPATRRRERMAENADAGSPPWFGRAERDAVERLAHTL
jgi:aryl-alcohol dehydrogenase-like predicted oxidoreductase